MSLIVTITGLLTINGFFVTYRMESTVVLNDVRWRREPSADIDDDNNVPELEPVTVELNDDDDVRPGLDADADDDNNVPELEQVTKDLNDDDDVRPELDADEAISQYMMSAILLEHNAGFPQYAMFAVNGCTTECKLLKALYDRVSREWKCPPAE